MTIGEPLTTTVCPAPVPRLSCILSCIKYIISLLNRTIGTMGQQKYSLYRRSFYTYISPLTDVCEKYLFWRHVKTLSRLSRAYENDPYISNSYQLPRDRPRDKVQDSPVPHLSVDITEGDRTRHRNTSILLTNQWVDG